VQFSDDIAGHDRTKLRLLNAAHSTLAYIGSLLGSETVAEAMRAPVLAGFVAGMLREDILPLLRLPPGVDGEAQVDAYLARFRNPAIAHRLAQIAWDGSQKLPVRLFGTIADALAAGRPIARLCLPVAAWMHFVRRCARDGVALSDPLRPLLAAIGRACRGDARRDVDAFLALDAVFGALAIDPRFVATLYAGYASLYDGSPGAVASALARLAPFPATGSHP
jgi:fructuronate reductase